MEMAYLIKLKKNYGWLLLENKLLTWKNMLKNLYNGPRICMLCRKEDHKVDRLFLCYGFSKSVWSYVCEYLNISSSWGGFNLDERFRSWSLNKRKYRMLPIFISWEI